MNGYDFDKTIYDGNSFLRFYFFCLAHFPYLVFFIPLQVAGLILNIYDTKRLFQIFYVYLVFVPNKEKLVEEFWNKHHKRIKKWYLEQRKNNDVIVSASPYFLLKPLCDKLQISNLIATDMDIQNGKIRRRNCYGKYKKIEFLKQFDPDKLQTFYSDSLSDKPMFELAKKAYLVKKNTIKELPKERQRA